MSYICWRHKVTHFPEFCPSILPPALNEHARDTPELSRAERQQIKEQISKSQPTTSVGDRVEIHNHPHLAITDGKVIGALAETESAPCNACGAKPSATNDLSTVVNHPVLSRSFSSDYPLRMLGFEYSNVCYTLPIRCQP